MIETMFLHRRHARRYRQIVRVLLSHGLGGIIAPFDPRGRRDAGEETGEAPDNASQQRAVHLRRAFEELGPTFVKLGQILSTRADLLSPVYIAELARLRDDVPPADADEIIAILEEDLGDTVEQVFATFEREPIAAASIGQVHAATLHDGRDVVVKVQRPHVQRIIQEDLFILGDVARIAEQRSSFLRAHDLSGLVREFGWTIRAELDYVREARNIERFFRIFDERNDIRIPQVFTELSTGRALTMERVDGIPIGDLAALDAAGVANKPVAEAIIRMLAEGILDVGFFHADPHPGNFVVDDDGAVVVYDFGMVGVVDERLRERLLMLILAISERDSARVVEEIIQLGIVPNGWDRTSMERDISHLIAQYVGTPLHQLPLSMIVDDLMAMMRRHRLHLPGELALLAKTATMAEALARSLDPSMNVITLVDPIIRKAASRFYSVGYWKDRLKLRPLELAMLGVTLPGHLQRILARIDRDDLTFHVHYNELPVLLRSLNGMVNRLALAVLSAAGMIGFAMVYLAVHPDFRSWHGVVFGAAFLVIAGMTVTLLIRIRSSGG